MQLDIVVDGEPTRLEWHTGGFTVGGGSREDVHVVGLPRALLEVGVDGDDVRIRARRTVRIDERSWPLAVERWLLPGERVRLARRVELVALAPTRTPLGETQAVLRDLMGSRVLPRQTSAPRLLVLSGPDLGKWCTLDGRGLELGRAPTAQLRLRDPAVSRRHARLWSGKEGLEVEDLGAPNGTFVDGERVARRRVLRGGENLEVGRTVLRFLAGAAPEAPIAETRRGGREDRDASVAEIEERRLSVARPRNGGARKR